MKKQLLLIISLTSLLCFGSEAYAQAVAKSMDFRISVYIPPIVGMNVPAGYPGAITLNESQNVMPETLVEQVMRNNQFVTLKTTVMR